MTKLENISVQTTQNKHRAPRHLANAVVTAGGLAGTVYLTKQAARHKTKLVKDLSDKFVTSEINGVKNFGYKLKVVETPIGKFFSKKGEKIFNPNNKLYGKYVRKIEQYVVGNQLVDPKALPQVKRGSALLLTAVLTGLGFIVNGIYQAGKINAE